DLDLVVSVTKTIFVVPRKNRIRFFDGQTNFVAVSKPVKLITIEHNVIDYYVLLMVFALANVCDIVLCELVHRSDSTTHPRSSTDLFHKRFDYQILSLGRCHARLGLTSVNEHNCETNCGNGFFHGTSPQSFLIRFRCLIYFRYLVDLRGASVHTRLENNIVLYGGVFEAHSLRWGNKIATRCLIRAWLLPPITVKIADCSTLSF